MSEEVARMKRLYYVPIHGRSHYVVRCECGAETEVYCWARSRKCPSCGKLLHLSWSGDLEKCQT
jgi:ribosomal protein S27E